MYLHLQSRVGRHIGGSDTLLYAVCRDCCCRVLHGFLEGTPIASGMSVGPNSAFRDGSLVHAGSRAHSLCASRPESDRCARPVTRCMVDWLPTQPRRAVVMRVWPALWWKFPKAQLRAVEQSPNPSVWYDLREFGGAWLERCRLVFGIPILNASIGVSAIWKLSESHRSIGPISLWAESRLLGGCKRNVETRPVLAMLVFVLSLAKGGRPGDLESGPPRIPEKNCT